MLDPGSAPDEAARLELVRGAGAAPEEVPRQARLQHPERLERAVQGDRPGAGVLHVDLEVILEVLADPGEVGGHVDPEPAQLVGRTHSRQQQELGRVDRAAGQDHLAGGVRGPGAAPLEVVDPGRAPPLEPHPGREGAGHHVQVRPPAGRVQPGPRRAPAPPPPGRHVHPSEAFLLVAVHVLGHRVAGLPARLDEGVEERVRGRAPSIRAAARPRRATGRRRARGPRNAGSREGPRRSSSGQAPRGPAVVVAGVAPDVHHAVDRGRASDHPAPWAVDAAAVDTGLGLAVIGPVVRLAHEGAGEGPRQCGCGSPTGDRAAPPR